MRAGRDYSAQVVMQDSHGVGVTLAGVWCQPVCPLRVSFVELVMAHLEHISMFLHFP